MLSETNFQATREHEQQRFNSSSFETRDEEKEKEKEERSESLTRREASSSNAILERFLKKLERDFQGEKKNGLGAQFFGTDQQPQNRLQNQKEKTDDTFHLLRKTLEESKSSLENERIAYASNVLELERAKRDVFPGRRKRWRRRNERERWKIEKTRRKREGCARK